jgi:hypothetical protein
MTHEPKMNPGPSSRTVGHVVLFVALVALILGIASIGVGIYERTANAPAETTVGQSRTK